MLEISITIDTEQTKMMLNLTASQDLAIVIDKATGDTQALSTDGLITALKEQIARHAMKRAAASTTRDVVTSGARALVHDGIRQAIEQIYGSEAPLQWEATPTGIAVTNPRKRAADKPKEKPKEKPKTRRGRKLGSKDKQPRKKAGTT